MHADDELAEFVSEHGAALLRTAYLLCGDGDRAQDLVQSALERTWRSWNRVQQAESPVAYVRRIVVREHLSWLRTRAAGERVGLPSYDAPVADPTGEIDIRDAVWGLLAGLPRRQRTVLVLRLFEDLSDNEIAEALGCRPATVRAHAARALEQLRADPALLHLHVGSDSHD